MADEIVKVDPVAVPAPAPKPGYRSSEFWLVTLAWLVTAFLSSGLFQEGSQAVKIASFIGAALASVGYSAGRSYLKGK